MNVAAHQEKERNETKMGKKKAEESSQATDSKKLSAALLRSFKGQHGEKMDCARSHWDPREDQQPFRLNPKGVGELVLFPVHN